MTAKKGFTLIELLIVIGIIAILAAVTILTLNPAQLLAESRDTQRLNDVSTINSALSLYVARHSAPTFTGALQCTAADDAVGEACNGVAPNVTRTVGGSGWVDVNFSSLGNETPISSLPLDPIGTQTADLHYSFDSDNTAKTWELNAYMESTRYSNGGTADKENTDGGTEANCYEAGSDPGLDLINGTAATGC